MSHNFNFQYSLILFFICWGFTANAQFTPADTPSIYIDTLRGSMGSGRQHWDVLHYDLTVEPDFRNKSISGVCIITLRDSGARVLQVDIQEPMKIKSITIDNKKIEYTQDAHAAWVNLASLKAGSLINPITRKISLTFQGQPKIASYPPWDGGWVWKKDPIRNPWMSVACQGDGASVWFPCKDAQYDEPDKGCILRIIVPDSLVGIGNGRLKKKTKLADNRMEYQWEVTSPINSYNIIPYIGKYVNFGETYQGLNGKLSIDYWVLSSSITKAKKQFTQVPLMLKAFEYWMGPYPFYEDGYKLVEAPYLGMEHQSNIAYGNQFKNGYLGSDLSETGQGLKWDYIIVHESGHEWFGNNITARDVADNWIHEGFTDYTETLYTDYYFGKEAGNEYVIGLQGRIANDKPIIAPYGIREEGSSDMYYKGANLLHTIRQIIDNDTLFRQLLIGLNNKFRRQTVTSQQVETYINSITGKNLTPIFNQYLRTTDVPELFCEFGYNSLTYHWQHTVEEFDMPVKVKIDGKEPVWIYPETMPKTMTLEGSDAHTIEQDRNFYYRLINGTPRHPKDEIRQ